MTRIFYTGTLIIPNGTDISVYGEPCEDGYGATMESGWVSPDWSLSEVYENRDDVQPDEWEEEDGDVVEWVIERLSARLIGLEPHGQGDTFYAADANGPWDACYTGVSINLAAHVEGLTPDQLDEVRDRLEAR